MFARLTGKIDSILENAVIIDVHGVGYLVTCSARTLSRMGGEGEFLRLHIETQVREDAINLYGFMDAEEQAWFRLLTTVQGVGARVGMAILGACSPSQIATAIAAQDKTALTRADGVGPKLATRIVTELKDKVANMALAGAAFLPTSPSGDKDVSSKGAAARKAATAPQSSDESDAVSALVNLGYARADAFTAVMQAKAEADSAGNPMNMQDLIRAALSRLASA